MGFNQAGGIRKRKVFVKEKRSSRGARGALVSSASQRESPPMFPSFLVPPTARGVDEAACLPACQQCQSARGKRHCASLGAEKQPRTDGRTDGVSGSKRERKGCGSERQCGSGIKGERGRQPGRQPGVAAWGSPKLSHVATLRDNDGRGRGSGRADRQAGLDPMGGQVEWTTL